MSTVANLLDQIDSGTMLLPEFQRGYVWNRDQVRGFMRSLYLSYPVGTLLVWETTVDTTSVRGASPHGGVIRHLLLDGQQRLTTLYGVVRGRPPAFFEGDAKAFTGLYFHVGEEAFEFYLQTKMASDPLWIDVGDVCRRGLENVITVFTGDGFTAADRTIYLSRLNRLHQIVNRPMHAETITGADKTIDVVVDVFNRVNSGGTKLSKGDLALAKICAEWPDARADMRSALAQWRGSARLDFTLDWLLRNVNAVATGRAPFSALEEVKPEEFRAALKDAVKHIGRFLDAVAGRLGLDHDRVLMGRYAVPVAARYLHLRGGTFPDARERDRFLYWYVQAALWGRFSGSTETVLAQDFETVATSGIDGLIDTVSRMRGGTLAIAPHEFEGFGRGSRMYPLLYLLTRVGSARDLGTGIPLKAQLLGHNSALQVHHIFPKALLYEAGYPRSQVNAVANFCFLTGDTNLVIGKQHPADYLALVEKKHPGALASQWIPNDPELWALDRYPAFLAARRVLLAGAANAFLQELRGGLTVGAGESLPKLSVVEDVEPDDRQHEIHVLVGELVDAGYAAPALDVEVTDPDDGRVLAVAEAFWSDGLQPGQGSPVVLELDPEDSDLARLEVLGYEVFESVAALRAAVERRAQVAAGLISAG